MKTQQRNLDNKKKLTKVRISLEAQKAQRQLLKIAWKTTNIFKINNSLLFTFSNSFNLQRFVMDKNKHILLHHTSLN